MRRRTCWKRDGDEKAAPTRAVGFILKGGKKLRRKFWFECAMANFNPTDAMVVGMYDKYIEEYVINKEYVLEYSEISMRRLT